MSLKRHKEDWERLAEVDPLWAVLTAPDRRGGGWDVDEFFATGEAEVAQVLGVAEDIGLPGERQRALDFGCGVGRLTRALGKRFESAVGVDISATMVETARRLNADFPACEFRDNVTPNLRQFDAESFDFVYSSLVLQHLRSRTDIERYVAGFLRVVRPGGLVVFGIPAAVAWPYRLQLRRRAYGLLRRLRVSEETLLRRTGLTPMRMTVVPEPLVRSFLAAKGAAVRQVETIDQGGVLMLRYYVAPSQRTH